MTEPPVHDRLHDVQHQDFDAFYRRELPAMVALAGAITGSTIAAEDLAQEALLRAYNRWDEIGAYDKPGAWVRRVTINLALTNRKRVGAELKARLRLGNRDRTAGHTVEPHPPRFDDVWSAVAKLPGHQRAAVALHYLEDCVPAVADRTRFDSARNGKQHGDGDDSSATRWRRAPVPHRCRSEGRRCP